MVSPLQVTTDLGALEAKFLERKEMLAPLDTRNVAEMVLRKVNVPSKNVSQNLNLNDSQETSIDMKKAGELEVVVPENLITTNIVTELVQIKNSVQYAINNMEGREADPVLLEQFNRAGIEDQSSRLKILSSMVALRLLFRAIGRYQTIDLIRAFTRPETLLVTPTQSTVVSAVEMGYSVTDSTLAEGIDIATIFTLIAQFKQKFPTPFTATVEYMGETKRMQFNAIILMTQLEINDLLLQSVNNNAAGTAVGNKEYLVFKGFDHVISDGDGEENLGSFPIPGYMIEGCLCLIMGNLYTSPQITALDIDTDYTIDGTDPALTEITRKIIIFHPSALTLWSNYEISKISAVPLDTITYVAMNSVRTSISKSLRNGAMILNIKRKIPTPTAFNFFSNKSRSRKVTGTIYSAPDFKRENEVSKSIAKDDMVFTDVDSGEKVRQAAYGMGTMPETPIQEAKSTFKKGEKMVI